MMTLLVNLTAIDAGDPADSNEVFADDIGRAFKSAYENSEQNMANAYIKGKANVCLGRVEPQAAKNLAANWNNSLISKLQMLIDQLPDIDEWPGNDIIGQLSDAARDVADDWSPFSDHGIYTANDFGNGYFKTMLTEDDIHSINENPEDWAIVVIFPE